MAENACELCGNVGFLRSGENCDCAAAVPGNPVAECIRELIAQRDAAWREGAEAMRWRAAKVLDAVAPTYGSPVRSALEAMAAKVRGLPVPPRPEDTKDPRDARIAALEARLAQYEGPDVRWYAYDPDAGYEEYTSADLAKASAEASLDKCRDLAPDGWPEGVEQIAWGRLIPYGVVQQTNVVEPEDDETGRCKREDFACLCDYELKTVREVSNA